MYEWFDETIGQLLDDLEQKGLADNTIVLYVCDNDWGAAQTIADGPHQQQWSGYTLRSKG